MKYSLLIIMLSLAIASHLLSSASDENVIVCYVDEGFDASTEGWQLDHFSDIQGALDAVESEGTVIISEGTYLLDSPLRITDKDLTIRCIGEAVLQCSAKNGIEVRRSSVTIEGMTIEGAGNAVFSVNSDLALRGNVFRDNESCGVNCRAMPFAESEIYIQNCIIDDNLGEGVRSHSNMLSEMEISLINNVIASNGKDAVAIYQGALSDNSAKLVNNILANNGGHGLVAHLSDLQFTCNDVWSNAQGNYVQRDFTGIFGNISADPLFSGNYYLSMDSPCIDNGLDVDRSSYGNVSEDMGGVPRPQGRYFDMGVYESTVVNIVHLSDPHLLAPVDGQIAYGMGYDTYIWEGLDGLCDAIRAELRGDAPDAIVFSGDIVNWATDSERYQTILGETYTVTEWKDTYEGYALLKERINGHFPVVPIYEITGNHDYREHPYQFWTWNDEEGIGVSFREAINYDDQTIRLSETLGLQMEDEIVIHLLDSGHDSIGTTSVRDLVLIPYLEKHATNFEQLRTMLLNISQPSSLYGFAEDLAYGSGLKLSQIHALENDLGEGQVDIVFMHHPVVYPKITIKNNMDLFLELCNENDIECVCSGHVHQSSETVVVWNDGDKTIFEVAGAVIDDHFNIIRVHVGSVHEYYSISISYH